MELTTAFVVIGAGVAVGFFSAMFGVGGGVIMVPFMVLVLDLTQHAAQGTSLLVIVPTAIVGVMAHSKGGFVSVSTGALLGVGGIVGSYLGASLALRIAEGDLQRGFAVLVIVLGARIAYQGARTESEQKDPTS